MTSWDGSTPAQSWTIGYDANGNRTQVTLNGATRAYTTSVTSNRLEQISNPVRSMSYDAAGNTLADTAMYSSAVYGLDNRLTAITKVGQTTAYSYDAGGQRVSKSNAAAPEQMRLFVYASSPELLGEYTAEGTAVQEVVWFEGQPLIVLGQANSNEVFFSYSDHLGAPRILVDRSGAKRWRWIAEPFGSTAAETAPTGQAAVAFHLRFPGQYFDAETGLNYNYFRNFDSTSGRYAQSDPIGLQGGINTYAYVEGNPLSYTDPMGLETYICKRPLGGKPGSFAPPVLNHTYVCVGSGENMTCGSTTASSGGVGSNIVPGSPGAPTTPDKDYYKPEACERRQGEDSCIETCIANELKKSTRPKYAIGPLGTDCQEYTEDVVSTCERRCVRR